MINIIKYCFENNKVASFYFDKENNEKHLTGYICYYNESEFLVAHITPRGEYDGFILNKIDNVYRIDYDSEYEFKIQKLYKLKEQSHPEIRFNEEEILYTLLDFAFKNNHLVTVELQNDQVTGEVNRYDDYICLNVVNDYGKDDGISIIEIDEIITFSCDTDREQDLKTLKAGKTGVGTISSANE